MLKASRMVETGPEDEVGVVEIELERIAILLVDGL